MYRDEATLRGGTAWHLAQGHTIFQLFQFGDERAHALRMLDLVRPGRGASVLSLGCGVGGLERLWQLARPDLFFELVNLAAPQLDVCLCEGRRVVADAETYRSGRMHEVVLCAYMLGHVDPLRTLGSALANLAPGGVLLLADVFDSSPEFDAALCYTSPRLADVLAFASSNGLQLEVIREGLTAPPHVAGAVPEAVLRSTVPAVVVLRR